MSTAEADAAKNRPSKSKFKQQQLPAWKPILSPHTVLPVFFFFGVLFIGLGAGLLVTSDKIKTFEVDYSDCTNINGGQKCADILENNPAFTSHNATDLANSRCVCDVLIQLEQDFNDDEVFMYYGLSNYYQNHRRYVKSRWDPQLRSVQASSGADCSPLDNTANKKYYAPCGFIANSLFNDTIQLYACNNNACDIDVVSDTTKISLTGKDIAWSSDRDVKFRNPGSNGDLCDAPAFSPAYAVKPPNWPVDACLLGTTNGTYNPWSPEFGSSGRGYENEDFIVWMRTAALPNFRKLYRRVTDPLPNQMYKLRIGFNYPVAVFGGSKRIVLSTTSWMGGKNSFLGVCYLVVGSIAIVFAVVFLILEKSGFITRNEAELSWEN